MIGVQLGPGKAVKCTEVQTAGEDAVCAAALPAIHRNNFFKTQSDRLNNIISYETGASIKHKRPSTLEPTDFPLTLIPMDSCPSIFYETSILSKVTSPVAPKRKNVFR